jgi:hypothetical protein
MMRKEPTIPVEELDERVRKLNGLFPLSPCWRLVQAKKDHEDAFGFEIKRGEWYYKRDVAYFDAIKYSLASMEQVVEGLFCQNPALEKIAEHLQRTALLGWTQRLDKEVDPPCTLNSSGRKARPPESAP